MSVIVKRCSRCARVFTLGDFLSLPLPDNGRGECEGLYYRNCFCATTLAIEVDDLGAEDTAGLLRGVVSGILVLAVLGVGATAGVAVIRAVLEVLR